MNYEAFKEKLKQLIEELNITYDKIYLKFNDGYTYTAYISTKKLCLYQCPLTDLTKNKDNRKPRAAFATKTGYMLSRIRRKEEPSTVAVRFEEIIENIKNQYINKEAETPAASEDTIEEVAAPVDDIIKVTYRLNNVPHDRKPTEDISFGAWELNKVTTSIIDLVSSIEQGMTISPRYEIDGQSYYDLLIFDIDNEDDYSIKSLESLVRDFKDHLCCEPIYAYPTFSDIGNNMRRYRVIYRFAQPVDKKKYVAIYTYFVYVHKFLDERCRHAERLFFGTNKQGIKYRDSCITEKIVEDLYSRYKEQETAIHEHFTRKMFKVAGEDLDYPEITRKYQLTEYANQDRNIYKYLREKISCFDLIQELYGQLDHKKYRSPNMYRCPIHGGDHGDNLKYYDDTDSFTCFSECNMYFDTVTLLKIKYNTCNMTVVYFKSAKEGYIDGKKEIDSRYMTEITIPLNNTKLRRQGHGAEAPIEEEAPASDDNDLSKELKFIHSLNSVDNVQKAKEVKRPGKPIWENGFCTSRLNFIVGPSGDGKSTCVYKMCVDLSKEDYLFNCMDFKIPKNVRSLLINFETDYSHLVDAYPFNNDDIKYFDLSNQPNVDHRIYLDNPKLLEAFFTLAQQENRKVIVFDPLYKMCAEVDDAVRRELEPYLDLMRDMALKYDMCVIIVMHTNREGDKNIHRNGGEVDFAAIQGSKVIDQIADGIISFWGVPPTDEEMEERREMSTEELRKKANHNIFKLNKIRSENPWSKYDIYWNVPTGRFDAERYKKPGIITQDGRPARRIDEINKAVDLIIDYIQQEYQLFNGKEFRSGRAAAQYIYDTFNGIAEFPVTSFSSMRQRYMDTLLKEMKKQAIITYDIVRDTVKNVKFIKP